MDSRISGRFIVEQPSLDDFPHMLAQMFSAMSLPPEKLDHLTERPLALRELKRTVHYLKSNKSGDHIGLVAEMLRYVLDNFLDMFFLFNDVLREGYVPHAWHITWSRMSAYHRMFGYQLIFKPIISTCLLHQIFVYMILSRVGDVLEHSSVTCELHEGVSVGDFPLINLEALTPFLKTYL